jgi:hypothetical protein
MHHALFKLINKGSPLGDGADLIQGASECRPKGRAKEASLFDGHLTTIVMSFVAIPHWVWSQDDFALPPQHQALRGKLTSFGCLRLSASKLKSNR